MCIESENTQTDTVVFTHSLLGVNGEAADDLHRWEDGSSDRTDIAW